MLTLDDLTQMAGIVLSRVEPEEATAGHEAGCHVDHHEIARIGIEEGLNLALRMLREQSGVTTPSDLDGSAADQPEVPGCLKLGIGDSPNGR
jgi:hypothetical protein